MKLSKSVKPVSYLKAHVSEILKDLNENSKTLLITQNGEAKAILQDIKLYEQTQEAIALLKIVSLSNQSLEQKKFKTVNKSLKDLKNKIKEFEKHYNDV
ncbi:Prevent-host-death family protein [Ignavibacterium album JCM 16511]|uniref:Antitoxin n=1 Tax=Ignavibacterium album (strain DSM 19864 / JCM 16511 / NBRC 101810 / Mat9-16) TaxID=945713 RepID=I0AM55_IGNAJ|nr:type II toxin-antitoxin system Phd/YefM family antitoxin [Ignavibacterium album]AFH50062.1 Prevent-host-death family protein [Ignavibacterium album JCM 16511]